VADAALINHWCEMSCCLRPRIAFRVTGTPEAGPQLRPIQFSATLSTLEAEQGAYELRVRGWRKFHLLDVRRASLYLRKGTLKRAWHVAKCTSHNHIATLCNQPAMTLLVDAGALTLPGLMLPLTTCNLQALSHAPRRSVGQLALCDPAGGQPDGQPVS